MFWLWVGSLGYRYLLVWCGCSCVLWNRNNGNSCCYWCSFLCWWYSVVWVFGYRFCVVLGLFCWLVCLWWLLGWIGVERCVVWCWSVLCYSVVLIFVLFWWCSRLDWRLFSVVSCCVFSWWCFWLWLVESFCFVIYGLVWLWWYCGWFWLYWFWLLCLF